MTDTKNNNDNVVYVNFIKDNAQDLVEVDGTIYCKPTTRNQYLAICKDSLPVELYEEILCSILDREYYDRCESEIQEIVHNYYSFPTEET